MTTKQILRVAYLVVALAVLVWIAIGGAIWSAWRTHREAVSASASAGTTIATTPTPPADAPFDRARSSVQYGQLGAPSDASQIPPWLARQIGPTPANARSMGGWVALLRQEGVQVCWKSAAARRSGEPDFTFVLPFERASVREVLDELCRRDTRYCWEWMQGSEVVNVLADRGLDVPVGDVSFRAKRLYHCLPDLSPYVIGSLHAPADPPTDYGNLYFWPVEIKAREITVRDYLNLAVAQYKGMTWTVETYGLMTLDAPKATRDAVAEKHRDEKGP